ncbi:hypothetical protein C8R44DRAFT_775077 [Mycena epipterygia]|nr:hypothetical protein C8R44DRAFT_775077 [Mycena epipterygia]
MQVSRILSLSSASRAFFSASRRYSARKKLPELPAAPLLSPFASVQSITQADLDHYVVPLYQRKWRIFTEMPNITILDDSLQRSTRVVPMLGKKFWFLRGRAAVDFLADVVDMTSQEEHEPTITLFMGRMQQHVVVRMHTARTLGDAEDLSGANIRPGLSARDLRLAFLLEDHFQEKYVSSRQALPLPDFLRVPEVPTLARIHIWQGWETTRAAKTIEDDKKWIPLVSDMSALPLPPNPEDGETRCTDAHFDTFLRPLYMRGWHAAFIPIVDKDKMYRPTLCLTAFFRFMTLSAAISFIRDIVSFPWYREDNAEMHFLVDAQTVRAQLVYPPEHEALTLGNLRAALRIERTYHEKHITSARITDVHPYRNDGMHQPKSVEELQRTRETPLREFKQRHNKKMARVRVER